MTRAEFIRNIRRSQKGDKEALGSIYEEYFTQLCITAYNIVGNVEVSYDVASNVILKLLEFEKDPAEIKNPVGYLITMVKNEAKNFRKKSGYEISVADIWYPIESTPDDMLWIEDIYRILSNEERKLFELRFIWRMTVEEVARQTGLTYGVVKEKTKKIKLKIRTLYEEGRK